MAKDVIRLAALGDLHYGRSAATGTLQPLLAQINQTADILVLCGDLTDYGLPEEARALVREFTGVLKIPTVSVLGNHDYESN
jgi:3',5'-cyclic AMP phosphodiesterase CpdA